MPTKYDFQYLKNKHAGKNNKKSTNYLLTHLFPKKEIVQLQTRRTCDRIVLWLDHSGMGHITLLYYLHSKTFYMCTNTSYVLFFSSKATQISMKKFKIDRNLFEHKRPLYILNNSNLVLSKSILFSFKINSWHYEK